MIPQHAYKLRQINDTDNVSKLQEALWTSKYVNENKGWKIDEHTAVTLDTDCYGGDKCRNRWLNVQYHNVHGQVEHYMIAAVGINACPRKWTNDLIEIHAKKILDFLLANNIVSIN